MNKAELIGAVAENAGLTKADAERAVKAVVDAITDCLKKGDTLSLVGFGSFSVSERAARIGKNPQTGAKINIPAAKSVKFKPGKALKDSL